MSKILPLRKNSPDGLNVLNQLLERVATLEAENVLLRTRVASIEQGNVAVRLSQEAADALSEYTINKIYVRLTPLHLLQQQVQAQEQVAAEAAPAEETPAEPEAPTNEHQHDGNS